MCHRCQNYPIKQNGCCISHRSFWFLLSTSITRTMLNVCFLMCCSLPPLDGDEFWNKPCTKSQQKCRGWQQLFFPNNSLQLWQNKITSVDTAADTCNSPVSQGMESSFHSVTCAAYTLWGCCLSLWNLVWKHIHSTKF